MGNPTRDRRWPGAVTPSPGGILPVGPARRGAAICSAKSFQLSKKPIFPSTELFKKRKGTVGGEGVQTFDA